MEFVTNELKLSNEELIAELQKETITLIGLKNTPYINTIVRGQKVELKQNENGELYVINKISNYKEYISSRDLIDNATTIEKWNAYTSENSEKINNALSLIGKSVKVKGVQNGSFAENSQTKLHNFVSSQENEIKGVIVGYDIPRDNFFVAFDIFEKINIPYNLASVLHSGNRSYMRTNCITYENSETLFTDILELDNAEPVHEIITDTRGFSIDKNAFPDSVLGYTNIDYNETDKRTTTRIFLTPAEARRNNYKKCKKCGLYHNQVNLYTINTNNYCNDCCKIMERDNKIKKCEICGKYERVANIKMVNNGNNEYLKICGTCATRYIKPCEECGKMHFVYNNTNNFKMYQDNRGAYHYFCNECAETSEKLTTCVECGDTIYKSDNDYFNYIINGEYYCCACFNEIKTRYKINSYHFKSEWRPQKLENEENPIYYGFELETENRNSATTEYLKNLHDTFPYIVFERDGSLYSSGAFETISEPLSMEFIKAHRDNIKSLLEQMAQYGATSHDNTTCGLHIHFTRSFFNEEAENKIITIFERFQNELIRFSRRKYSEIMHWTKFNGTDLKNIDIENIKKIKPAYLGGRYNCINLTNKKTIECRLFRGTLKFETFMACFELLDNIIAFVLHEDNEKINKCKFIDILKYKTTEYLINYCKIRNIIEEGDN